MSHLKRDLALLFLCLILAGAFVLLATPRALVKADNILLNITDFEDLSREWTEVGPSPWLNNSTANYIHTKKDAELHLEFIYANVSDVGILDQVVWWVEMKGPSGRDDRAEYYLKTPNGWWGLLSQDDDSDNWTWYNVDVTTEYDALSDINGSRLKIQYLKVGTPATQNIYVRRSYLNISYTPLGDIGPEPSGSPSSGTGNPQHLQMYSYNSTSIAVINGTLNDGNLASTYLIDGDWYNVSETNGVPGLDIRVNFTDLGTLQTGGCFEFWHIYSGHSNHEVQVQLWNFTDSSWELVGTVLFNETAGWKCVGLSPQFEHYFNGGKLWARFYHATVGHVAHELQIDEVELHVSYTFECPPPEDNTPYIALGIILLLFGLMIGSRLKT